MSHFFVASDGSLYDTRRKDWHKRPPLRPVYRRHFRSIETTVQFKASIRAGRCTFPGGYTLAFVTSDGGVLCFDCARREVRLILDSIREGYCDGWQVNGMIWSDECDDAAMCDHCGEIAA